MSELQEGNTVKDKVTGKLYIVLKTRDPNPQRTTPVQKIAGMFADPLKEDIFCKRMEDGVLGWKFSAELRLIKK